MRISFLIDTNVAIQLEEVDPEGKIRAPFQEFHSLLVEHGIPFFTHPLSKDDLENDTDQRRKAEMLSRLGKYPCLSNPPKASGPELEKLFAGINKSNDLIDCQILFALYRNCTSYLVTEDEGIHRRARIAGLDDRVYRVHEAVDFLLRQFRPTSVHFPAVNEEFVYSLRIEHPFFDSLKASYKGFEKWFKDCCEQRRKCWTIVVNEELAGLCIYKHDEKEEFEGVSMPSMKLCTFKVDDRFLGRKYGELLLKTAFNYAIKNRMATVWVTAGPVQTALIHLLKTFGFQVHSEMKGNDLVFFKNMIPPKGMPRIDPLDFHVLYSPHVYRDQGIRKFVIPIQPQFHDVLFPEFSPQPSLSGMTPSIPGNTIRKVYLSHSKIREIEPGSLIYFYRSSPEQQVCTLGIVERTRRLKDVEALASAIGKRSVYSYSEVEEMVKKGEVFLINFRLVEHAQSPIHLRELVKTGIFNRRPPFSIMELPHDRYLKLKALWK